MQEKADGGRVGDDFRLRCYNRLCFWSQLCFGFGSGPFLDVIKNDRFVDSA